MELDEDVELAGPLSSVFGQVRVALPTEEWPRHDRLPMLPLCQINCAELPLTLAGLDGVEFLAVFCVSSMIYCPETVVNGDGWRLRAYSSLDDLVEIKEPPAAEMEKAREYDKLRPIPIRWVLVEDQPGWAPVEVNVWREACVLICEKRGTPIPKDLNKLQEEITKLAQEFAHKMGNLECSKIGGWPTNVQDEVRWWIAGEDNPAQPEYIFQIGPEREAGWMWGDCGFGVFGRGTGNHRDEWFAEWACY